MGVKDLLKKGLCQFLESKTDVKTVTASGYTRGVVDNSGWMHAACSRASIALQEDKKRDVIHCVQSFYKARLNMLGKHGVKHLHFVFDGCELPSKAATKVMRDSKREAARQAASKYKAGMSATSTKSQKKQYKALCTAAVVRPPWLRSDMFKFLDDYKGRVTVSWEVALFEADAQIGHLLTLGLYQSAIAED